MGAGELGIDRVRDEVEAFAHRRSFDTGRPAAAHVVVDRDAAAAVLRHVERTGAELLVVAPHGAGGWRHMVFGGVTEHVLRHAAGSVLVARGRYGSPVERILAGVVPDAAGAAPLRHAIALARVLGATLTVVHVVTPTELLLPRVASAGALRTDDIANEKRALERWVASFPARGVRVEARVMEGGPARLLVEEAVRHRADLIVVGATHGSRLRRALLGDVAYAVAAASPVSVLVVRERRHTAPSW
jgi:universal stress protein E